MQVESAKNHLRGKQKALEDLPAANDRRGKVCTYCHTSDPNRNNCNRTPCYDVNSCKLKAKHPELLTKIRTLQRELKELEQKYAKVKSDHEVFSASRQQAKSTNIRDPRSYEHYWASIWNKTWKRKKIQGRTAFEPMIYAIPAQRSTSWANKPTGNWSIGWV